MALSGGGSGPGAGRRKPGARGTGAALAGSRSAHHLRTSPVASAAPTSGASIDPALLAAAFNYKPPTDDVDGDAGDDDVGSDGPSVGAPTRSSSAPLRHSASVPGGVGLASKRSDVRLDGARRRSRKSGHGLPPSSADQARRRRPSSGRKKKGPSASTEAVYGYVGRRVCLASLYMLSDDDALCLCVYVCISFSTCPQALRCAPLNTNPANAAQLAAAAPARNPYLTLALAARQPRPRPAAPTACRRHT